MESFTIKRTWLSFGGNGWGNGYVIIPKGHRLHGILYDEINKEIDVHGGLTFSEHSKDLLDWNEGDHLNGDTEGWVVGFDTAHYGDDLLKWPEEKVKEETERLKAQLEAL